MLEGGGEEKGQEGEVREVIVFRCPYQIYQCHVVKKSVKLGSFFQSLHFSLLFFSYLFRLSPRALTICEFLDTLCGQFRFQHVREPTFQI